MIMMKVMVTKWMILMMIKVMVTKWTMVLNDKKGDDESNGHKVNDIDDD